MAETARLCRTSPMTIYRAIASGEFPAVRIRGRLIIPTRAIEEMVQSAMGGGTADAAAWVPDGVAEQLDPLGLRRHPTHRGSAVR